MTLYFMCRTIKKPKKSKIIDLKKYLISTRSLKLAVFFPQHDIIYIYKRYTYKTSATRGLIHGQRDVLNHWFILRQNNNLTKIRFYNNNNIITTIYKRNHPSRKCVCRHRRGTTCPAPRDKVCKVKRD